VIVFEIGFIFLSSVSRGGQTSNPIGFDVAHALTQLHRDKSFLQTKFSGRCATQRCDTQRRFLRVIDLYQCVLEILIARRSRNISAGLRQSNMAAAQGPT